MIAQERNVRPFRIAGLRPIQMSNPNVLRMLAGANHDDTWNHHHHGPR